MSLAAIKAKIDANTPLTLAEYKEVLAAAEDSHDAIVAQLNTAMPGRVDVKPRPVVNTPGQIVDRIAEVSKLRIIYARLLAEATGATTAENTKRLADAADAMGLFD